MPLSRRGNVSPFARVRPQRWGKKVAFHQIPFLVNSKNRANVKIAVVTLGTGDLLSHPSRSAANNRKIISLHKRNKFIAFHEGNLKKELVTQIVAKRYTCPLHSPLLTKVYNSQLNDLVQLPQVKIETVTISTATGI
ncbi:hypothetical protein TNCV_4202561 [Trichonephila clavipes]|uniref:Uncharacterized protein n=1 Tax=Trichonephila clavipes TaxID=2585209 RepID=A0A8X6S940_TRICX|nr:hypothetical protein TNCV_4202561 [Trichonephila clavipes]